MIVEAHTGNRPAQKILVAPLDWGWGHASRVIPLVWALQGYARCEVVLGISGMSGRMLASEFPGLTKVALPMPVVRYARGSSQVLKILLQLPRLFFGVLREHRALKKAVIRHGISAVISDNRYGLYSHQVPSVLMLHQVRMSFPGGVNLWTRVFNRMQRWWMRRFDQVWIPDLPGEKAVAGFMSAAPPGMKEVHHIGLLSRFFYGSQAHPQTDIAVHLLVVLSGPEPQRSRLEALLNPQLEELGVPAMLVRGVMGDGIIHTRGRVSRVSHLLSSDLQQYMRSAHVVVCRSGYSSVMDLIALRKQAVLIPTPGQPEQQYLAGRMMEKGWFYARQQERLDLPASLRQVKNYFPPRVAVSGNLFERINSLFVRLEKGEGQNEHRHP